MKPRKVTCPRCGSLTEYSLQNKSRPFCSERCRLIDLGKWATEEYRVPESSASKPGSDPDPS